MATGKSLRIICVGKVKTDYWHAACDEYIKRIGRFRKLTITEVRDADQSLPVERRKEIEAERLLAALEPGDVPIVMDERGKDLPSQKIAETLHSLDEQASGTTCFIVGGPFGLTEAIRKKARLLLRLGAITLPHELARVVLLEQIYRAECILRGIAYHH